MKNNIKNMFIINENGIAVIFVLGFLALLFMLTAVYTTTSIIDKKASENTNALQEARMLSQTGLSRSMASLNRYISDETVEFSNVYSYRGIDTNDYSDSLGELLETKIDGVSYFTETDYVKEDGPHWLYLPENFEVDSVPITGRIAYLVIAESGKLDLSACVDSGYIADLLGTDNAVSEGAYSNERTSLKSSTSYVIGRPGRDVNELFLDTIDNGSWFNSTYATDISSYFASPRGKLKGQSNTWKAQWDDFTTLFNSLGIEDDNIKQSFKEHFSVGNYADPEAFWIDDGDGDRKSNEFFKRFQLNRDNWDLFDVDSLKQIPCLNTSSDDNEGLLWFKNWKSKGGMASIDDCRNQVIANLIDYNDSDNNATTDDENNPTYVGLENAHILMNLN